MDYGEAVESRRARRVTIKDVAASAGVSISTVSHALNDKGEVNAQTRQRVRAIASDLGYRPHRAAQAMRGGAPRSIALALPRTSGSSEESELIGLDYYLAIASASASEAFARGNSLVLPPPLGTSDQWAVINPDGVLICDPSKMDQRIDILESMGIPVVTIEPDTGRLDRPYFVTADTINSTTALLDHLKGVGATKVALLWADSTWSWAIETRRAYETWCDRNDQEAIVAPVPLQALGSEAYRAAGELLDGSSPPDAIFASAERYSTGALQACHERRLRVPEDVLIVGGVDGSTARLSYPPVTAVDPRPRELAEAAVRMLMDRIDGNPVVAPVTVRSEIHLRASSTR
ncbi:LacI family DNA-binding transcriptional regulator [Rhodococcus sp. MSC1_016]|jgi:DNA-binding LacI/PurR family transcriptional regulator|uniref:LacI family DNA-binding transcriptional regulator n=1 Tax=Rhodococcus sp. MSC1_016 TaxID=2909266 RepID=UPI00202DC441|nr:MULTISPECIES: LacI family DNA-binding transcriptional regulator [Rhodococcus]